MINNDTTVATVISAPMRRLMKFPAQESTSVCKLYRFAAADIYYRLPNHLRPGYRSNLGFNRLDVERISVNEELQLKPSLAFYKTDLLLLK